MKNLWMGVNYKVPIRPNTIDKRKKTPKIGSIGSSKMGISGDTQTPKRAENGLKAAERNVCENFCEKTVKISSQSERSLKIIK